jgi:hypothetical protein
MPSLLRLSLLLSAAWVAAVSAFPATAWAEEAPSGRQVQAVILRSIDALKKQQAPDGTWPDYAQPGGVTALATYALLQAGVSPDDKALAAAIEQVRKTPNQNTYVVALKTLALVSADAKKHAADIQSAADWLIQMQTPGGGWGYGKPTDAAPATDKQAYERPDLSNTQFAILALSEAERAGAKVAPEVWHRADRYLRSSQLPGGGWGYVLVERDPNEAYGSMTAAAVASLFICTDRLTGKETAEAAADRLASAQAGLDWMADRFTLKENPGRATAWYYFWLYGLERAGVASGRSLFGQHDWFREGTGLLVAGQRPDGSWTDHTYENALCLLFLAKGYKPVLVQRMTWEGQWRKDPRDLDRLVRFLGYRVGGVPVAWQTVRSDAPLPDFMAAPILQVAGRGTLRMIPAALPHLKEYVEQGGLLLFDAEGGDKDFLESVRRILSEQFPQSKLEPLPPDHPIATAVHKVGAEGLEIMNVGCRASIVVATQGLAEKMAAEDPASPGDSLRLGENLAVYATAGAALPDRLAVASPLEMPRTEPPRPGAWRIGQVQYDGDWNPRPYALPRLAADLNSRFKSVLSDRPLPVPPTPVKLTDKDLNQYTILYMTGHYALRLSDAEKAALKAWMADGTRTLVAEACCGSPVFDESLRRLMKELFPESLLEELPADHPIFNGKVGVAIPSVTYSPAVQAQTPGLARPVLFGLVRDRHLVLVYSPYGLAVGMDGQKAWAARTLVPDDARRLATNIMLYLMH